MGQNLKDVKHDDDFIDTTPRHNPREKQLISWISLKLKTSSACKRQCQENEKINHRLGENICKTGIG